MKLGFVFTNFNNSNVTREAVHSIYLNNNWTDTFIVVVDNNSDQNEVEILKTIQMDYPRIQIVYNNQNYGYFKGLNIGIKYLRDIYVNINHIIIGNNDLVFPSGFIESIYTNVDIFNIYPVISPDLITLDGVHQNPHVVEKINKFREFFYDLYHASYRLAILISFIAKATKIFSDRKDEEQFEIAQTIYQGYGACYILGPVFFDYFDQLWAPSFLMGEEFFLSKQLESKNLKIYYTPFIKVIHKEHAAVSKIPRKNLWQFSRESHKLYRKYVKIWK